MHCLMKMLANNTQVLHHSQLNKMKKKYDLKSPKFLATMLILFLIGIAMGYFAGGKLAEWFGFISFS